MRIKVVREYNAPCAGGHMEVDDNPFGVTLERPWDGNKSGISAIPAGAYAVHITFSTRFQKNMLEIMDVPDRAGIRIHNANHYLQVEGCIAVAEKRLDLEHIFGGKAMELLQMVEAAGGKAEIEIVDAWTV